MYNKKEQNGFTLIELVVSIALLGVIVASSGMIFKISIETHRMAMANAEIMQKFRAISMQLDTDFQDMQTDAPLMLWFQTDPNGGRYDKMMFFTTGDYQSTQRYHTQGTSEELPLDYQEEVDYQDSKNVRGNTARVYYGLANLRKDSGLMGVMMPWDPKQDTRKRVLTRRTNILTADPSIVDWHKEDLSDFDDTLEQLAMNDRYEHDRLSLTEWKNIEADEYEDSELLDISFGLEPTYDQYSWIDLRENYQTYTLHNLMCEGVGSFAIQWAYWDDSTSSEERIRWFPIHDLDGLTIDNTDSHFKLNDVSGYPLNDRFGVIFKVTGQGTDILKDDDDLWKKIDGLEYKQTGDNNFNDGFYPRALKFTMTIYDSKNIIKGGRTFTKIIYLGI